MSLELIKKPITLDEMTKREVVQVIKERDIIVPDGKPDMQKVLQLDGKMTVDQLDVSDDRIMYRGNIEVCVLYANENKPRCVYTMKGNIPVEDFVILDGVTKDQRVEFEYNIEHMSYNILNERKLNVKAIIQICVAATCTKETMVITDLNTESPIQTQEEVIEITTPSDVKEDKIIVKEDLTVPQTKPSINELLKSYIQIIEEQVKRTETEILYNGMLEVATMYKTEGEEDAVEVVNNRVPFQGSISLPKNEGEMFWDCTLQATPSYMKVAPDYDGEDRIIECEFIICAKYYKLNKNAETIISDVHCPGKKVTSKDKQLDYMNLQDRMQVSVPKKEAISIENFTPENNQIFCVLMKPSVEEKVIGDDKLTLKGVLEVKVIYTANEVGNIIDTSVSMIPFTQELEVKGITNKSLIMPRVTASDVKVYAQNKKEIVIEYILNCLAEVYNMQNVSVLEDIGLEDMSKEELANYPSMTVYQVKKGDTLWDLAKRFNTTVKDIQEINGIDTPDVLHIGQKLIILKKVKF
ncbi:hypothetical protein CS063_16195 [Sporanaerobium hydrogeniformans]|uniref:Uncharacterized protein n=1 Tax=Sporanaerobium hydrogeniformans TaxID=3072179 RepID=A0AC61D7C2_9FIRM|nr:SPOCS domain-containing protein [Sporanaerobium hydrogeniformans]PHV69374.1 hypothetical protein CS063_16195 [Sporanaerobium hydrogeniformans]